MRGFLIYGAIGVPVYMVAGYLSEMVLGLGPSHMFFAGALTGALMCGILELTRNL